MLGETDYTMNDLFAQLGLDSDDTAIEQFIATHQLPADVALKDADFLNDAQRAFIIEERQKDAVWALVIDELNACLHSEN